MSKYIFLDTNNWIYLSNGFNVHSQKHDELHIKIFDIIKKRHKDGSLKFITNEIVIQEWIRNKTSAQKQIKDAKNKYNSYNASLNKIEEQIGDYCVYNIDYIKTRLERSFNEKIKQHKEHVNQVEDFLLNETIKVEVTDKAKLLATDLSLNKKAPFIGQKSNSMADALLLLSSIQYIEDNKFTAYPLKTEDTNECYYDSYFVSSNSNDFSSVKNKEAIHEDLEPYLIKTGTKFYYTYAKLIKQLEEEFQFAEDLLTEEESRYIEELEDAGYCENCNYPYYPSLKFSEYYDVYTPLKVFKSLGQPMLPFPDLKVIEDKYHTETIRIAACEQCSADFFECSCGALNTFEEDSIVDCENCGIQYKVAIDKDRKGVTHGIEIEITSMSECVVCGEEFEELNHDFMCNTCAEYEKQAIEN